jgi:hypothetical protein
VVIYFHGENICIDAAFSCNPGEMIYAKAAFSCNPGEMIYAKAAIFCVVAVFFS